MPAGAMAAMTAAEHFLWGEAADVPVMLSASSVDESASEQGDSSADEPLLQSEEEIASEQVTVQTPTVLSLALNVVM